MRLDRIEREAIKYSLKDFSGDAYLFGSRLDDSKKGGDIDLLLIPGFRVNPLKLSLEIQRRFFSHCEQSIDVIIYTDNPFCKEILKGAFRLDIERI